LWTKHGHETHRAAQEDSLPGCKVRFEKLGLLKWSDGKNHQLPQDFADMQGWKEMADKAFLAYKMISVFKKWTLIAGIVISITLVIFTFVTKIEYLNKFFINYLGLMRRGVVVPFMI
jgi:hypothetical protein